MKWRKVIDQPPENYVTVLTFHENDIYPVCAFTNSYGEWRRVLEGPEDNDKLQPGYYEQLVQVPTHWADLSELNLKALSSNPETFDLR